MKKNSNLIYLADDDLDDTMLFKEALNEVSSVTKIQSYPSGSSMIDHLNSTDVKPDIIFLDLNMPGKSGLECLRDIRSNPKFSKIAVAIYSTFNFSDDVDDAYDSGANLYIKKVNNFSGIKKIVKVLLSMNWPKHNANLSKDNFYLNFS